MEYGCEICWETHRSRPTFNPWATRDLLLEIPGLRLNCDFSHWCVVCERLVMDEEPEILGLCAERCRHLHARVGYPQGPQVPEPRDRLYRSDLEAHLRWWQVLVEAAEGRGAAEFSVTAEFGPDGDLYTVSKHGDLDEIWIFGDPEGANPGEIVDTLTIGSGSTNLGSIAFLIDDTLIG